jgi:hypothetical protein
MIEAEVTAMTTTARLHRVHAALRSVAVGSIIGPEHQEYSFLRALFGRHPESVHKYRSGLAGFRVVARKGIRRTLDLVLTDGSETPVSFVAAAKATGRGARE